MSGWSSRALVGVGRGGVDRADRSNPPPRPRLAPVAPSAAGDPAPGAVVLVAVVLQEHLPLDDAEVRPGEQPPVPVIDLHLPLGRREPPLLQPPLQLRLRRAPRRRPPPPHPERLAQPPPPPPADRAGTPEGAPRPLGP